LGKVKVQWLCHLNAQRFFCDLLFFKMIGIFFKYELDARRSLSRTRCGAGMTVLRNVIPAPAFAGMNSSGNPGVLCTEDSQVIFRGKV
jgi:hypothetical protein